MVNKMKAKKKFGQNFLIDNNIIFKISQSIAAKENDLIIEIGPGMGALTKSLQEKNAQILAYEIDTDMIPYLNKISNNKTKVIYKDILEANIEEDIKEFKYNKLFVVGNLPYYITTPIIKHLIKENIPCDEMVFMVQEEVADRYTANPNTKDYSSITLYLKYYFDLEKLFKVSKKCFNPVPKVESAIIRLKRRENVPRVDKERYFKLIEDSFKMKRKTLKNNLNGYDMEKINNILEKNNLSSQVRAEEIEEKVFIEIAESLE